MISNERPSPYGRRPFQGQRQPPAPRPFVQEDTLKTAVLQIERKIFTFTLKENPRARLLRITEENR
ncbi:MAG: RNA-binding protein, partial [Verrucomicrobiota bacterium]